jgi:chemotaxis protein methyltransferase CheR
MNAQTPIAATTGHQMPDHDFQQFCKLIHKMAGIHLTPAKKTLVAGRLANRLQHHKLNSYGDYYRLVTRDGNEAELQTMVDLLTTNETYFFREPQHFDFLREVATRHRVSGGGVFRIWSAAASSGEEAYSMAMVLAHVLGDAPWEIVGTDISTRVLAQAERGLYRMDRISGIPLEWLRKYCLKGQGEYQGMLLIAPELRRRVRFVHGNLLEPRQELGAFDVIFLRNVMIYFDNDTKAKVVARLLPHLRTEGHFVVGHSETLNGISRDLTSVRPTIYRRFVS